ncbi:hypothetical protein [Nannocystis bainbridge]|uniref:Uncharacterized protein n=1 Tax=Nannocystis bainbridge TaxID=2995303 RepID=A0ABT5EF77_9BACT|nr:hypothetical protein [Nannocystis bainbridge]MDC0723496.1 hypothetical protein [Nannocystis bainbridge]
MLSSLRPPRLRVAQALIISRPQQQRLATHPPVERPQHPPAARPTTIGPSPSSSRITGSLASRLASYALACPPTAITATSARGGSGESLVSTTVESLSMPGSQSRSSLSERPGSPSNTCPAGKSISNRATVSSSS